MIVTDESLAQRNSELIVTLAKQALDNLSRWPTQQLAGARVSREEFGTVKIALPRQSGHTTAALQLMYEYPGSLLFVPDSNRRYSCQRLITDYTDDYEVHERIGKNTIILSRESIERVELESNIPFIIFDGAAVMTWTAINEVAGSVNAKIILELQ